MFSELSTCIILVIIQISAGAKVVLETNSAVINPIATKKLEIRCSVKKDSWDKKPHSLLNTESIQSGASNASVVSTSGDFEHLMSIVVTEGKRETIASVTGCDPPVVERSFVKEVTAEGSSEISEDLNEMGYLKLTWDRPLLKDANNFTCEAFALNSEKASVSLVVSIEVTSVEPDVNNLLTYIAANDRSNERSQVNFNNLEQSLHEIRNTISALSNKTDIVEGKLSNLKAQNIQMGVFQCGNVQVEFDKPFKKPPKIFTSIVKMVSQNNYQISYEITFQEITKEDFSVVCTMGSYSNVKIEWLAIDV